MLAFTGFLGAHWKQVWSNNPQERLNNGEGGGLTSWASSWLVGALAEQHDEWAVGRRYLTQCDNEARGAAGDPDDTINRRLSSDALLHHIQGTSGQGFAEGVQSSRTISPCALPRVLTSIFPTFRHRLGAAASVPKGRPACCCSGIRVSTLAVPEELCRKKGDILND